MSRDRRGQWQRDRGGGGRRLSYPSQNPRGSRPRAERVPSRLEITSVGIACKLRCSGNPHFVVVSWSLW